jgi:hypothetical protein
MMNGIYGIGEAYDEAYDETYDESDETYDEFDEARRRGGRRNLRPINPPRAPSAFRPRATGNEPPVSQTQFRAALARVSQEQNKDRQAIKLVDGRVRAVGAEQGRMTAAMRKETDLRNKAVLAVRRDLQATREVAAIAPLLGNLVGGQLAGVLPLLLLSQDVGQDSGAGGTGISSGLGGSGGLGGILPLVLLFGALGQGGSA